MKAFYVMLAIFVMVGAFSAFTTSTEHYVDLDTGKHSYVLVVANLMIHSNPEKQYYECDDWINPYPDQGAIYQVSSCPLIGPCEYFDKSILSEGCST